MDAVRTIEPWDEALARLLTFLDEFEVGGVEHRTRVALRIVDEARASDRPGSPVERVMQLAFAELDQWFGIALEQTDVPPGRRLAAGSVALQVVPGGERWSESVLLISPTAELKGLLAKITLRTGPDFAISSMTSREMDYGAMETLAHETWHQFAWTPLLRAAAIWTAVFFLALYVYDRYYPQ